LPGDLAVAPALVPDELGQFVEGEDVAYGCPCLADDNAQLLLGVLLFRREALEGFGFFDGRQVLAEEILDEGDLGVIAVGDEDGRNGREACIPCSGDAAFSGDDDQLRLAIWGHDT
jgi:hypothetical protein